MSKFAWTVGICLTGTVSTWLNVCVIFQLCKAGFLIALIVFCAGYVERTMMQAKQESFDLKSVLS